MELSGGQTLWYEHPEAEEDLCDYVESWLTKAVAEERRCLRLSYSVKNGERWTWVGWICAQEDLVGTKVDGRSYTAHFVAEEHRGILSSYSVLGWELIDRARNTAHILLETYHNIAS